MSEYIQHWGEIPPLPDIGSGIAAVERAELTARQPLVLQSLKTGCHPNESQNQMKSLDVLENSINDVPIGNPVMLHTIRLLQFLQQINDNNGRQTLSRQSIPQMIEFNENETKKSNLFQMKDKNFNQKAIKQLLRRAVIVIAVFHGYDTTNQSVIDLLVDILSEYLCRLCETLRTTNDSLELMSSNDFIDVMDRVFHDMNVSDFESLRQYDSDIRLYNQNLIKEVNKKIDINESTTGSNKITNQFQLDPNCDNQINSQSNSHSDGREPEPTLSLKSLLNSFKV